MIKTKNPVYYKTSYHEGRCVIKWHDTRVIHVVMTVQVMGVLLVIIWLCHVSSEKHTCRMIWWPSLVTGLTNSTIVQFVWLMLCLFTLSRKNVNNNVPFLLGQYPATFCTFPLLRKTMFLLKCETLTKPQKNNNLLIAYQQTIKIWKCKHCIRVNI